MVTHAGATDAAVPLVLEEREKNGCTTSCDTTETGPLSSSSLPVPLRSRDQRQRQNVRVNGYLRHNLGGSARSIGTHGLGEVP